MSLGASFNGTDASDFSVMLDECHDLTLGPGESCNMTIGFRPSAVGQRSAGIVVAAGTASNVTAALTGAATAHVTVVVDRTWCNGNVTTQNLSINCGQTCEEDFTTASVTLHAQPVTRLGTSCYVDAWSVGGCNSSSDCVVPLTSSPTITVSFSPRYCVDPSSGADGARGSCSTPFRTLTHALEAAATGDLVQLKPGVYSAATNGETFPISVPSGVTVVGDESTGGDGSTETRIDGLGVQLAGANSTVAGLKFTLSGTTHISALLSINAVDGSVVRSNSFVGNLFVSEAVSVRASMGTFLKNNNMSAFSATGVFIENSDAKLEGNIIAHNNIGVSLNTYNTDTAQPDLGGGTRSSIGLNVFSCNDIYDMNQNGDAHIHAEHDYWDHANPTRNADCTIGNDFCASDGDVDALDAFGAMVVAAPCQ